MAARSAANNGSINHFPVLGMLAGLPSLEGLAVEHADPAVLAGFGWFLGFANCLFGAMFGDYRFWLVLGSDSQGCGYCGDHGRGEVFRSHVFQSIESYP